MIAKHFKGKNTKIRWNFWETVIFTLIILQYVECKKGSVLKNIQKFFAPVELNSYFGQENCTSPGNESSPGVISDKMDAAEKTKNTDDTNANSEPRITDENIVSDPITSNENSFPPALFPFPQSTENLEISNDFAITTTENPIIETTPSEDLTSTTPEKFEIPITLPSTSRRRVEKLPPTKILEGRKNNNQGSGIGLYESIRNIVIKQPPNGLKIANTDPICNHCHND